MRRERETREREAQQLSGNNGRELFLECLQLVLRKQVAWLVRDRGLPAELEAVVRDLWDLRVRSLAGLRRADDGAGDSGTPGTPGGSSGRGSGSGSGRESEPRVYYSHGETGTSTAASAVSKTRSWDSDLGEPRTLPKLADTLALCYLGCLLLRLPVRVGDLFRWAKRRQILYLGAVSFVTCHPFGGSDR